MHIGKPNISDAVIISGGIINVIVIGFILYYFVF